jgi:hypothetical protein
MVTKSKFLFTSTIACLCASTFGQSVSTPTTPPASERQHLEKVTSCLSPPVLAKGEPLSCTPLTQRMAELHHSVACPRYVKLHWGRVVAYSAVPDD